MLQYCRGLGLEIGPGRFPYCPKPGAVYLDSHTDAKGLPYGTPSPDIVARAGAIPRPDGTFDYVLSAHVLEHMQNTIPVLREWIRVLKPGGVLFTILPHAERTIDRYRAKTTLAHHIRDAEVLTDDFDTSHNDEIREGWSKLPDFEEQARQYESEWGAPVWDFKFRFEHDVIHFHVWTQDEIVRLLQYLGLVILAVVERAPERPDSFVVVARRPSE